MKKIFASILLITMIFAAVAITASAKEPEIMPLYDSTQNAKTDFTVDVSTRYATITVSIIGDSETVSGIGINVRLETTVLATDVWLTQEEWSDYTDASSYINSFSKIVPLGRHRAVVEYTVYSTDGSTDVITHTIECTG